MSRTAPSTADTIQHGDHLTQRLRSASGGGRSWARGWSQDASRRAMETAITVVLAEHHPETTGNEPATCASCRRPFPCLTVGLIFDCF